MHDRDLTQEDANKLTGEYYRNGNQVVNGVLTTSTAFCAEQEILGKQGVLNKLRKALA